MSIANTGTDLGDLALSAKAPRGGTTKRAFDCAAATLLFIAFLPLILFVAIVAASLDRGPVFFGHSRVGHNGRRFRCLKFRSMVPNAAEVLERHLAANPAAKAEWDASQKLRNDPRVTRWGAFLRTTSLDELPQLINVIRGDMSLVGPRPIVEAEMSRYGGELVAYLSTRPGITGLWQVSGRSDIDYERRVALDAEYARSWSMMGDVMILLRTVKVVFSRSGSV